MGTMRCVRRDEKGDPYKTDTLTPDEWRSSDNCCSYCGGLNPEEVLKQIKSGIEVGPTDKNYKIYLGLASEHAYFQHFSDEQKDEFIKLYNDRTMKIGHPGGFYVVPYFMVLKGDKT